MTKALNGAPAPVLTTAISFHPLGDAELFQVRPGMPARDALQAASQIFAAARGVAEHYCDNVPENPNAMFATVYLIDMGKALLDSVDLSEQEGGAA